MIHMYEFFNPIENMCGCFKTKHLFYLNITSLEWTGVYFTQGDGFDVFI